MTDRPWGLITGASRGIGAAVATALADSHDLLLGGRDLAALERVAGRLPSARPWPVELTDTAALRAATTGMTHLDLLVHSAGIVRLGTIADAPAADWRDSFESNVIAVVELTQLLLPALRAAGGHVVLINSGAGQQARPGWAPYAASKFALRAFADALRAEEEPNGVRVTSVYPGRTATDMQREVRSIEGGEYTPEHYLRPESVAELVRTAVTATPDAHIPEITVRPTAP